jgi:hypothetical protein
MNFIKSLINKFSKNIPISEMFVDDLDPQKSEQVELKAGSGKIVKVYFYETEKEIDVSADVALILINRKKAELCQ